jgi:hypothetical protein
VQGRLLTNVGVAAVVRRRRWSEGALRGVCEGMF